jgi:hypothetical protein
MAKSETRPRGNRPIYIARVKQTPESEFMTTIGAAFAFKEGDGLVVKLHVVPTDWDGSFILVPPPREE